MSLPVGLRDEARDEFRDAYLFNKDRRPGLGDVFARNIQEVFDRIALDPSFSAMVPEDIRKATVRKFPYCVFWRADPPRVEVMAVFHTSKDPKIWLSRP